MMNSRFHPLAQACFGLALAAAAAHAGAQTAVLDSYSPSGTADGWPSLVYSDASGRQDVALPFTISAATSIASIMSSLDGTGGVTLGIFTRDAATPSGVTWLYSAHLNNPTADSTITPTGWSLAAGTYWLAAVADSGFQGTWQSGTDDHTADFAFRDSSGTWQVVNSDFVGLPAARITVSAVPEPASYALLLGGALMLAALRKKGGRA